MDSNITVIRHKFDASEPRDEQGQWTTGGSSGPASPALQGQAGQRVTAELDTSSEAQAMKLLTRNGKTPDLYSQPTRIAAKVQGMKGMADVIMADPTKLTVFQRTFGLHSRDDLELQIRQDVTRWARTASDNDPQAISMQRAVMDVFHTRYEGYQELLGANRNIGGGGRTGSQDYALHSLVDQAYAKYGEWDRTLVSAMYAKTQEMLSQNGIDHLTLYRSMGWPSHNPPLWAGNAKDGGKVDVAMQPMASWAATRDQAENFNGSVIGGGMPGVILSANVPAARILATPFTGFGALMEHEFVTLDTAGEVNLEKTGRWDT